MTPKGTYTVETQQRPSFTNAGDLRDFYVGVVVWTGDDGTREAAWTSALFSEESAARHEASESRRGCEEYLARNGRRWEVDEAERIADGRARGEMEELLRRRISDRRDEMYRILQRLRNFNQGEVERALPGVVGDALVELIRRACDIVDAVEPTREDRAEARKQFLTERETQRRRQAGQG